jgi:hypothetical protein
MRSGGISTSVRATGTADRAWRTTPFGRAAMSDLPKPEGWNTRYLLFGSLLVFAACGGAYFAFKTVLALAHTHWLASAIGTAAAVALLIPAVWIALMLTGVGRLRASADETGTTLGVVAMIKWTGIWFGAVVVGIVLYLVFGSHVTEFSPDFRVRSFGWLGIALLAGVLGLGLVFRAGRRELPALRLSAGGVDFHDAISRFTLAWGQISDITGVLPASADKNKRSGNGFRPIVFEHRDGEPAVIPNAALYAPGGRVLFWMIRHYWRHPQERAELANGVAVERLRAGRFTAE